MVENPKKQQKNLSSHVFRENRPKKLAFAVFSGGGEGFFHLSQKLPKHVYFDIDKENGVKYVFYADFYAPAIYRPFPIMKGPKGL